MTAAIGDTQADNAKRSSTEKNLDKSFIWVTRILAIAVAGILIWIAVQVGIQSRGAIQEFGWSFWTDSAWNPVEQQYGVLPMIYGTIVSSAIALLIAVPIRLVREFAA